MSKWSRAERGFVALCILAAVLVWAVAFTPQEGRQIVGAVAGGALFVAWLACLLMVLDE